MGAFHSTYPVARRKLFLSQNPELEDITTLVLRGVSRAIKVLLGFAPMEEHIKQKETSGGRSKR
jgi:hypothetical protein